MKKRFLVTLIACLALFAALALCSSAATPDKSRETVTLADGTDLPIWDEDGSGLIWYISGVDADTGKNIYAAVSNLQQDKTLGEAYVVYTSKVESSIYYSMSGITVYDKNGTSFSKTEIVVANFRYTDEKPLCLPNQTVGFNSFTEKMFYNCTKIQYVLLPDAFVRIPGSCFYGCSSLKEMDASNTRLEYFGGASFQNCSSLTYVAFPDSLTGFNGQNMFYGCSKLKEAYGINRVLKCIAANGGAIPNGLFRDCSSLETDVILYDGLSGIGEYAFIKCAKIDSFKNLVIPNTVLSIGRSAFNACAQIETLRLSASLNETSTGYNFADCSKLKEIYIPTTLNGFQSDALRSISSQCVFYYTGTQDQAAAFQSNTSNTKNPVLKSATIKSLDEYNALTEKSGSYLVYGYNKCDAFYGSEHNYDDIDRCTVNLSCSRECGHFVKTQFIEHSMVKSFTYANGFDNAGVYTCYCENASYCTVANTTEETAPIVTFKGYSIPETQGVKGINAGFKIDKDLLADYNEINEVDASLTLFMVNSKNGDVNIDKILDGETLELASGVKGINVKITSTSYTNISVEVRGFDDSSVTGNYYTLKLITAIAVKTEEGTHFVQAGLKTGNDKQAVDGVDFNIVSAEKVYSAVAE